jgi:hypothetical protein
MGKWKMIFATMVVSSLFMFSCANWKQTNSKVSTFDGKAHQQKQLQAQNSCDMKTVHRTKNTTQRNIASMACPAHNTIIYGGQHYNTGNLVVTNTATEITFNLTSAIDSGWYIKAYHIYVGNGPIPTNSQGIPAPGSFPFKQEFSDLQTGVNVTVDLASIGQQCGSSVTIAVHTEMVKLNEDGEIIQEETGWAYGPNTFDASRWGWSFNYEICCNNGENSGCTLTQGYWKTHSKYAKNKALKVAWPISEDSMICGKTWYNILHTSPKGGDAWTILAHQYIAAQLNVASGASTGTFIDSVIAQSTNMLTNNCSGIQSDDRQQALEYSLVLDNYNNGFTGPGHCE